MLLVRPVLLGVLVEKRFGIFKDLHRLVAHERDDTLKEQGPDECWVVPSGHKWSFKPIPAFDRNGGGFGYGTPCRSGDPLDTPRGGTLRPPGKEVDDMSMRLVDGGEHRSALPWVMPWPLQGDRGVV